MTKDHRVPTQNELEAYITKAKIMRSQVLVSLGKRLFHFPGKTLKSMAGRTDEKIPMSSTTS